MVAAKGRAASWLHAWRSAGLTGQPPPFSRLEIPQVRRPDRSRTYAIRRCSARLVGRLLGPLRRVPGDGGAEHGARARWHLHELRRRRSRPCMALHRDSWAAPGDADGALTPPHWMVARAHRRGPVLRQHSDRARAALLAAGPRGRAL